MQSLHSAVDAIGRVQSEMGILAERRTELRRILVDARLRLARQQEELSEEKRELAAVDAEIAARAGPDREVEERTLALAAETAVTAQKCADVEAELEATRRKRAEAVPEQLRIELRENEDDAARWEARVRELWKELQALQAKDAESERAEAAYKERERRWSERHQLLRELVADQDAVCRRIRSEIHQTTLAISQQAAVARGMAESLKIKPVPQDPLSRMTRLDGVLPRAVMMKALSIGTA